MNRPISYLGTSATSYRGSPRLAGDNSLGLSITITCFDGEVGFEEVVAVSEVIELDGDVTTAVDKEVELFREESK